MCITQNTDNIMNYTYNKFIFSKIKLCNIYIYSVNL